MPQELLDIIEQSVKTALDKFSSNVTDLINSKFSAIEQRLTEIENSLEGRISHLATIDERLHAISTDCAVKLGEISPSQIAEKISTLKRTCDIQVNDIEQHSRLQNIRIHGLVVPEGLASTTAVTDFVKASLKLSDVSECDIDISHPLPSRDKHPAGQGTVSLRPPSIIVRFARRQVRDRVLRQRKLLKGTKVVITEDLTVLNSQLLNRLHKSDRINSAWTWQGKVYCVLTNGKKTAVKPFQTIDELYS